jgi:hypothetical protein
VVPRPPWGLGLPKLPINLMNARCFSIKLLKLLENKKNKEILRGGNYDYKMEGINSLLSVEIMNLGLVM